VQSKEGGKLLFLSNRNGSSQLWLQDKDSLSVMDSLNKDSSIDEYSWHPNGTQVLVAYSDKTIYLLDTEKNTSQLIDLGDKKAGFPQFSNDGKSIYFSSDASGDWQLWSFKVDNEELKQLTKTGGYRVKVGQNKKLYFTKYREKGIWQLDLSTQVEANILDGSIRSDGFSVCDNKIIYEVDDAGTQLWQFELDSKQKQLLLTTPNSSRFTFSTVADCQDIIFSQWENIESDVMMMTMQKVQ